MIKEFLQGSKINRELLLGEVCLGIDSQFYLICLYFVCQLPLLSVTTGRVVVDWVVVHVICACQAYQASM